MSAINRIVLLVVCRASYKSSLTALIAVTTISHMQIEFDPDKRDKTLTERGLDFARAGKVFSDVTVTAEDARFHYGEPKFTTVGVLDKRMVVMVWTPRLAASSA